MENITHDFYSSQIEKCVSNLLKKRTLTNMEEDVLLLHRLQNDMYNGGFIQFFCNWGYDNFIKTTATLINIGATKSSNLLNKLYNCIAIFENDKRVKNLWDLPMLITPARKKKLEKLNNLYCEDIEGLNFLIYNYLLKNNLIKKQKTLS